MIVEPIGAAASGHAATVTTCVVKSFPNLAANRGPQGNEVGQSYFYERYQLPEPQGEEAVASPQRQAASGTGQEFQEAIAEGDREPVVIAAEGVRRAHGIYGDWISRVMEKPAVKVPEDEE